MLDIALIYIYPLDAREGFLANAKAWKQSYLKYDPGVAHRVILCMPNGTPTKEDHALFEGIDYQVARYDEGGWDIGAYQSVAKNFDCDLMIFCNSRVRFWKGGWMIRFVEAWNQFGPKGLYGASGSYERCFAYASHWPNPHIRTSCFATNPHIFRRFPYTVRSRDEGFKFEAGEWNFMKWYEDHGWPVRVVTWDGMYDKWNWRNPPNIFRRGNQTNCLVWDRHHDLYFSTPPDKRWMLEHVAGKPNVLAKPRVLA